MDTKSLPIPVGRSLRKLGMDVRDARRRRRIPMYLVAERAGISRSTLDKIEKGDAGVAIGSYACVLFVLGLIDRLTDLADIRFDKFGIEIEMEQLPKRIRMSKWIKQS
jgi:transcriptional regulator with XRE-family HTH domain